MVNSAACIFLLAFTAVVRAEVTRPCETSDVACIQSYLSGVSGCTPVSDSAALDPYVAPENIRIENPFLKTTVTRLTSTFTGLSNSYVSDFYIDTENQKTVLITYHPAYETTGDVRVDYHAAGQIDVSVYSTYRFTNEDVTVKTVWNGVETVSFSDRKVTSEIGVVPTYNAQTDLPGVYEAAQTIPIVAAAREAAQGYANVKAKEDIAVIGAVVNEALLSNLICY